MLKSYVLDNCLETGVGLRGYHNPCEGLRYSLLPSERLGIKELKIRVKTGGCLYG